VALIDVEEVFLMRIEDGLHVGAQVYVSLDGKAVAIRQPLTPRTLKNACAESSFLSGNRETMMDFRPG